MEFMYRAGDERRSRSPSQQTLLPSPALNASSISADGQLSSGADADEARRQAQKTRIRERILHEETVDRFDLELEVRLDLVERFRQRCVLNTRGAQLQVAPPLARVIEANSSSPVAPKVNSKASAPADSLAKRKSSVHGAASSASVETSSKKQKLSLTCTVCGITANAEKAMQDHLNGKRHKRKAAALAAQPTTRPEPEPEPEPEDAEEEQAVFTAACGEFKPMKFTMVTNQGMLNQVTQMDGYLLCEVCNVRTADHITMMCHFEGTKHISRAQKKGNASPVASANGGKEEAAKAQVIDEDTAAVDETANQIEAPLVNSMQEKVGDRSSEPQEKIMAPSANKDVVAVETSKALLGKEAAKVNTGAPPADFKPTKFTMVTNQGTLNQVTQMDGYLLCEVCNVRTADRVTMMCHFEGTKHISRTQKTHQDTGKPPACTTLPKKRVNEHATLAAVTSTIVAGSDPDTVVLEVGGEPHTVFREGGVLLCERCGVMAPSESGMWSHLLEKKHKKKANASSVASVNVTSGGKEEAAKVQVIDKDTAAVDETASQIKAPLAKPVQEKVGDRSSELQEKIMALLGNKDVVPVETSKALLGKEVAKVSTCAAPAVANAVGHTDLTMELYGVRHPLRRVEGILLCPCCDVKTTSESDMRYHLVGKKHKKKMTSTAMAAEVNIPKMAKAGGDAEADTRQPTTVIAKIAAVAPMELDAPATVNYK